MNDVEKSCASCDHHQKGYCTLPALPFCADLVRGSPLCCWSDKSGATAVNNEEAETKRMLDTVAMYQELYSKAVERAVGHLAHGLATNPGLSSKVEKTDVERDNRLPGLSKLKRWSLQRGWMAEDPAGDYVKFADVQALFFQREQE